MEAPSPSESTARHTLPPLSPHQERLWTLHHLVANVSAYNLAAVLSLQGPLDADRLQASFHGGVQRHAILQAAFPAQPDGSAPSAPVLAHEPPAWSFSDLTSLPRDEQEARAEQLLAADASQPFDLEHGPLVRGLLLRLADDQHLFLLVAHEMVCDTWSVDELLSDIGRHYSSQPQANGQPAFADVVASTVVAADRLADQRQYWTRHLDGALPLDLPTDAPRPPIQSYQGGLAWFTLPAPLTRFAAAFAHEQDAEPFTVWLAVVQAVLARYANQDNLVIGTPVPDADRARMGGVVGPLTNLLALRADLSDQPSLRQLVQRNREELRQARANQDLPFEQVIAVLGAPRDTSRPPVFQVAMAYEDSTLRQTAAFAGLTTRRLPPPAGGARYDLYLRLRPDHTDGLSASVEYCSDLFSAARVQRLGGHVATLLAAALDQPDQPLADLPILAPAEAALVLHAWNATGQPTDDGQCLHHAFEAQARQTPDAVAVVDGQRRVTYATLNHQANRVAARLRHLGVGPEVLVGVFMERTAEMLAALLGVLKAGGGYVPLDPAYPADRLAFILEDAGAAVLLTQERLTARVPTGNTAPVVAVDSLLAEAEAEAEGEGEAETTGEDQQTGPATSTNLAYVIYTSGSTGRPKGVAIEHRSAVIFVQWARSIFTTDELRGMLASTSICFDLSVYELFTTLSAGGTIILVEDALHLHGLPAANQVTLINSVPSVMTEVLRQGPLPPSVRTVNLAGEPLPNVLAQNLYAQPGVERVYNLYGPSEDTTYSTGALVERGATEAPTIGRPIAGSQAYVLDPHRQPLPIGVAGELYLAGAGLARGYLNRPELTAEKFVPNPFSNQDQPAARMYRTGDLVRYRADGEIEFLGRIDNQVKIRGFRIELGEVEHALAAEPAIKDVVVVAREDAPGEKRLVAYLVSQAGSAQPGVADLRAALRRQLPVYMVPSSFVFLERLPQTPNGKIDRKALPTPDQSRDAAAGADAYVAPRDAVEQQLVGIWEDLLKVHPVGVADDFFDLGGHSLLVAPLFSRVQKAFGRDFPLATIFEAPTIEELAALVRQPRAAPRSSSLYLLQRGKAEAAPAVFMVHGGQGTTLVFHQLVQLLSDDYTYFGVDALGLDGSGSPHTTLEEFAAQYVRDIQAVQPHGPYYLTGYCFGGVVIFQMALQLRQMGEDVALVGMFNATFPAGTYERVWGWDGTPEDGEVSDPNLAQKVERRRQQFARLTPGQRVAQVRDILKWRYDRLDLRMRHAWAHLCHRLGLRIPQALRPGYFLDVTNRAEERYHPSGIYPGKVTVFSGAGLYTVNHLGWADLAAEVEIHEIPGRHFMNRHLMVDPYVQPLAEEVRTVLSRATREAAQARARARATATPTTTPQQPASPAAGPTVDPSRTLAAAR